MKKKLGVILIILVLIQGVYSQTDKQQIADIDKIRIEIKNNLDSFQKIEKFKDTTGYRYEYKKDNELKIIMVQYKDRRDPGKYIDKKVEWYFSNGHMIYTELIWTDIATNMEVDNQKCYLNDQHMIAWIKFDNTTVDKNSQEFKDMDTKLVAYGIKLKEEAN